MILTNYAIKFRVAVVMLTVVIALFGAYSYVTLPREGSPDITIPYVFITATYEGTSPVEMEKLISIPIEKKLNEVENVKEIHSTSSDSLTFMSIEFIAGENIDLAKQRVKDKVDLARPDLPDDLDEPIIDAFNFSSDFPVFTFALSGTPDIGRMKNLAEDLQDRLELLSGVRTAEISGTREREVRVEIDLPRMIAYGLPLSQVMGRIAQENKTVSAGNMEIAGDKFQVRIPGEFERASEMNDILLAERNGQPVYLTDIATITDTFKDLSSIARINSEPAVSISVKKRSGINSVWLIRDVKKVLESFRLPPGIKITVVMDESEYIDSMIKELENNIFTGFALVVVVLMIFLGLRNSLFVAIAIPLSMMMTFVLMGVRGQTVNMIVLFSLVMAVGMLVDNGIVMVENIYRNRTLGLSRVDAARKGASEVAWPVITSTLTTLVAFAPLLFWPDIMGQFMSYLPRTLILTLSASLFVAIVVNPAICSMLINARPRDKHSKTHPFIEGYERFLRGALHHRGVALALGFVFLIFTVLVFGRFGKGVELFPSVDPRNATVQVQFPQGTSIERTDELMRWIETKLPKYEDIKFYLTTIGSQGGMIAGGAGGTHLANIHIEFVTIEERKNKSMDIINRLRDEVGTVPGVEIKVEKQEEGPPVGAPVTIEISGDDFDTLADLSAQVQQEIETVPGLVDLQDDYEEALPEIQFRVDRHRAALMGLDTATIGTFLRMSIYGLEVSKFRADEDEYDITLRLPLDQRNTMNLLDQVYIPTAAGKTVPLSSLGEVVYTGGRGAIHRKDQKRVITVTGNDAGRGVDKLLKDVRAKVDPIQMPRGYAIQYTGENKDMQESGAFLLNAFLIAVGLIAVILVIQFNSAVLPAIIMFEVVLSMIGVMWGLLISGMRFGIIMTGVGVISLAGVVVNNGIVLIDCINQRRAEGMSAEEAAIAAGKMRLRPVLLTAITTLLGLIPMAAGWSLEIHAWPWTFVKGAESGAWWAPMAIAIIYGLTLATVLTLVQVPIMYSLAESMAGWFKKRFSPVDELAKPEGDVESRKE